MALIQRYTEDNDDDLILKYDMSFYVSTYINELPSNLGSKISTALEQINYEFFIDDGDYYYLGGVIQRDTPFFFSVALLIEEGHRPFIADIKEDELDEYLDYVKAKNTIKDYEK